MKKPELTKIETKYKRFDLTSKIAACFLAVLTIVFCVLLMIAKSDEFMLLFGLLIVLDTLTIILFAAKMNRKRNEYLQLLQEERKTIVRKGIFKEVYDAYKHDGFEFNLIYDKLQYIEYYNNTIDICAQKNKHEILIEIDKDCVSIIIDEETDCPIETEIPLATIATIEELYLTINNYINENC